MLRLGLCTDVTNAPLLKDIGFDYFEINMSQTALLPQKEFDALLAQVAACGLPVKSMNVLLPGATYNLMDPALDQDALAAYLRTAFSRAGALGVEAVSFGSGGARRVPDGMPGATATQNLVRFLRLAGPIAVEHGVTIAIEPLRAQESNIINSVAEARALCAQADAPGVGVLADLYHMLQGGEDTQAMQAGPLAHLHIAHGTHRGYPLPGDGCEEQYRAFFQAAAKTGYSGGISIEGSSENLAKDASESFALLAKLRKEYF